MTVALLISDTISLARAGYNSSPLAVFIVLSILFTPFFVPVYLFRRAKILRGRTHYAVCASVIALGLLLGTVFFAASLRSRSSTVDEIAGWVKEDIVKKAKTDEAYAGLEVTDVALVRESAGKYTGFVEFRRDTRTERADLLVTIDHDNRIYKCEPPRSLMLAGEMDKAQLAQVDAFLAEYPELDGELAESRLSVTLLSRALRWGGDDFVNFLTKNTREVREHVRQKYPSAVERKDGADPPE